MSSALNQHQNCVSHLAEFSLWRRRSRWVVIHGGPTQSRVLARRNDEKSKQLNQTSAPSHRASCRVIFGTIHLPRRRAVAARFFRVCFSVVDSPVIRSAPKSQQCSNQQSRARYINRCGSSWLSSVKISCGTPHSASRSNAKYSMRGVKGAGEIYAERPLTAMWERALLYRSFVTASLAPDPLPRGFAFPSPARDAIEKVLWVIGAGAHKRVS